MTKEILGDACAFIKGPAPRSNKYLRIGIAMKDGDRISLKLDTLPIDKAWEGWINIFPREEAARSGLPVAPFKPATPSKPDFYDDDIPF